MDSFQILHAHTLDKIFHKFKNKFSANVSSFVREDHAGYLLYDGKDNN